MSHAHQSGARHCADLAGMFSGEEWAPKIPEARPEGAGAHETVSAAANENPLIRRLDVNSLASLAEFMGLTVQQLIERYSR